MERKIIIGLITNTEFCQGIKSIWNPLFIESITAKRLSIWCWEYFDKYSKAPGKDIEGIFQSKIKIDNLPEDISEDIAEILEGLSKEYEEYPNLDFLLEETKSYFSSRHLSIHTQQVEALRSSGKISEAQKMMLEFKPLILSKVSLDSFILTVEAIRKKAIPQPSVLMSSWLREGQITIIYGNHGTGKSLITLTVAYLLGLEDYDTKDCEIGEWQVKSPTGCLYVDGELGEQEMENRIRQFEWLGKQQIKFKTKILSVPDYQIATQDQFYLAVRENQLKIMDWLKRHPNYKLLVLDSASTLFGLLEENDNSEWNNKINPFLRDLRALKVACILLHHSGKEGKRGLRGASSMGAMAHNIFRITNHDDKKDGEAWFSVYKEKQRASGYMFKDFYIKFSQTVNEKETHWELT